MRRKKRIQVLFRPVLVLLSVFIVSSCSDVPINEYQPKNQKETEIVALLKKFLEAKNQYDLDKYLSTLHEEGMFQFRGGIMISKKDVARRLPGFWKELNEGVGSIRLITHEEVTGDNFTDGRFVDPRITITGDTSETTVKFLGSWWLREDLYLSLVKENGQWLIKRLEWEQM